MKLTTYLFTMIGLTAACWLAWAFVVFNINPEATKMIGFSFFYSFLFLSLVGTAAVAGFLMRFIFLKHKLAVRPVVDAFRQSFWFAGLVVVALLLLSHGLFSWLNLFFLVSGLAVLELFMISYKTH